MPQRTQETIFPADPGAYGPASYDDLARGLDPGLLAHVAALGLADTAGREFLDSVARDLASLPGARGAFVGVLQDPEGRRVRTVARYVDRAREDDVVFAAVDSAACEVVGGHVCVYPAASATFPGDDLLAEFGGDAFLGAPLLARDGTVIGLLGVIADPELEEPTEVLDTMLLLAGRASLELERLLADRLVEAELDRLEELLVRRTAQLGALRSEGTLPGW
jgi:GAF domain-containing protein